MFGLRWLWARKWRDIIVLGLGFTLLAFAVQGYAFEAEVLSEPAAAQPRRAALPLPVVAQFSSVGDGPVVVRMPSTTCVDAGLTCPTGRTCLCSAGSGRIIDGVGPINNGDYSLVSNADITNAIHNGSTTCFLGTAILNLSAPDGLSSLILVSSGSSCNLPLLAQGTFYGSFDIVRGTGNFSKSVGAGLLDIATSIQGHNIILVRGSVGSTP